MSRYDGLNIQYPISGLIASGKKTIETRTYPISKKYLNKELILIETPGPKGNFKARAIAIIKITECFKYPSKKKFYEDSNKHFVTPDSPWAWKDKAKYAWRVRVIKTIFPPVEIKIPKGIIYTKDISLKN
jgi:hypothetical protein